MTVQLKLRDIIDYLLLKAFKPSLTSCNPDLSRYSTQLALKYREDDIHYENYSN